MILFLLTTGEHNGDKSMEIFIWYNGEMEMLILTVISWSSLTSGFTACFFLKQVALSKQLQFYES